MSKTERDVSVDALRGLLLMIMGLDHIFCYLFPALRGQGLTFESLGYCSAAEGFFFLSGYSVALAYLPKLTSGTGSVRGRILSRVRKMYLIQVGLVVLALMIHPCLPGDYSFEFLSTHPLRQLALALVLLYQPTLLDILPVYILFMLATPTLLEMLAAGKRKKILLLSLALWGLGQIYPFGRNYHGVILSFFNPLSWQALFVLGICATRLEPLPRRQERILLPTAGLVAIVGFVSRQLWGYGGSSTRWWLERSTLGLLRMINVLALFYLIGRAKPFLERLLRRRASAKPWILAGQSSLKVFTWQVATLLLLSHWSEWLQHLSRPEQAVITVGSLLLMGIPVAIAT